MLFDSIEFVFFLPIVFSIYWLLGKANIRRQNVLLIVASYVFYGWWDWRFLLLIFFSSGVDYLVGIGLSKTNQSRARKQLLWLSILFNVGLLAVFKYYDFFATSLAQAFTLLGQPLDPRLLNVVLPVGISFYTFQTISYSIDVYRKKLEPTRDPVSFFAFVSFFPQLVSGPIERATHLLPQFQRPREFSYDKAVDGMRQILWGFFKKVVIADNCAKIVDFVFTLPGEFNGSTLAFGAIFFAVQVYCDFSGYSDIAIGTARLFGFDLKANFRFPYFSRDIGEFWRRWHISLFTWFRDYIYIPLGGSRQGVWKSLQNVFVVFIVSGLWHGASWKFFFWGILNGIYFLPVILNKNRKKRSNVVAQGRLLPNLIELSQMGGTMVLIVLAFVVFRVENIHDAVIYMQTLFSDTILDRVQIPQNVTFAPLILLLFVVEWLSRERLHGLEGVARFKKATRWLIYMSLILIIVLFKGESQEFVYFQF